MELNSYRLYMLVYWCLTPLSNNISVTSILWGGGSNRLYNSYSGLTVLWINFLNLCITVPNFTTINTTAQFNVNFIKFLLVIDFYMYYFILKVLELCTTFWLKRMSFVFQVHTALLVKAYVICFPGTYSTFG